MQGLTPLLVISPAFNARIPDGFTFGDSAVCDGVREFAVLVIVDSIDGAGRTASILAIFWACEDASFGSILTPSVLWASETRAFAFSSAFCLRCCFLVSFGTGGSACKAGWGKFDRGCFFWSVKGSALILGRGCCLVFVSARGVGCGRDSTTRFVTDDVAAGVEVCTETKEGFGGVGSLET